MDTAVSGGLQRSAAAGGVRNLIFCKQIVPKNTQIVSDDLSKDRRSHFNTGSLTQVAAIDKLEHMKFFTPFCLLASRFLAETQHWPAMNGMPAHLIAQAARQHKADSHAEHQMNKVRHDLVDGMNARYGHAASKCVGVLQLEKWALDAEAHTLELAAVNRQLRAALAHAQKVSQFLSIQLLKQLLPWSPQDCSLGEQPAPTLLAGH